MAGENLEAMDAARSYGMVETITEMGRSAPTLAHLLHCPFGSITAGQCLPPIAADMVYLRRRMFNTLRTHARRRFVPLLGSDPTNPLPLTILASVSHPRLNAAIAADGAIDKEVKFDCRSECEQLGC